LAGISCKICGGEAPLHGVVDFNKSCELPRGLALPLLGVPVWYRRCVSCGFLFTVMFDDFTPEDWKREVYNDGYAEVDPDYAGARAEANAPLVRSIAAQLGLTDPGRASIMIEPARVLDYGSGNGALTVLLADLPADCAAWDPLQPGPRPVLQFDLVTAFEVFEHTTTPIETAREALGFLRPGGALLFSTLVNDDLGAQEMNWYAAPRNGHVSIHSTKSLDLLFAGFDFGTQHLTPNIHMAMAV
jgi:methyltransferase family protein